jgi:predicted phosphodiesterase
MMNPRFNPSAVLALSAGGRVLVMSDFHMGDGGRSDDLVKNEALLLACLSRYFDEGWHLVLNGDIEELQRHPLKTIRRRWKPLYDMFDAFARESRLLKTLGNHDEELIFEEGYPYPLYNVIRIETGVLPVFVYHGHQSSRVYTRYNTLVGAGLKYVFKPIGIRNLSSARSPRRRFHVEKKAYDFSLKNNVISIIGHTHRELFESLGRFSFLKFEIERLCREYPRAEGLLREEIAREVRLLQTELGMLKKAERRYALRESLYGQAFPVPCLFNSGSAIGKKGVTAIELTRERIALVHWPSGGEPRREVLNEDRLERISAKIELLGGTEKRPAKIPPAPSSPERHSVLA